MPITFPLTKMTIVVEIALGADLTADSSTWSWTDITAYVRYQPQIVITRGRRDEGSTVDPATARLTLDNRDGRFVRRNPVGAYYGQLSKNTPIRIGVNPGDSTHYRFHGFVNEWPTRWTKDVRDSTVPITCAGILRRLAHNQRLGSALTRAMAGISAGDFAPVAHWPLEDGANATQLGAAVPGTAAASVGGTVTLASYTGAAGSDPVPVLSSGGQISGVFPSVTLTPRANGDTIWQVQFMGVVPSGMSADSTFYEMVIPATGGDNITKLKVQWINASTILTLRWYDSSGTQIGTGAAVDFATYGSLMLDTPTLYGISIYTSSASPGTINAQFAAYLPGQAAVVSSGLSSWTASSMPVPKSWSATAQAGNAGWSFSHLALYTDPGIFTIPNQQDNADAINGFTGETAADRMTRVCREEGVAFTTSATSSAAMGPQPNTTLLGVLRDCEAADQGVLYELEFGLGYLAASERYNLTSALDLNFDNADLAEPPEPADDDQQTVNQYTAARTSGSSAIDEDAASITADGLYSGSGTFNVETDDQLPQIASWQVHLGTVDEDRWPAVPIRLARTPAQITSWVAVGVGSRMTMANPPDQTAPDTISAIVEGWAESISPHMWAAVLNTSPAQPYEAFTVEDQTRGRLDTAGCILNEAVSAGATSLKLHTYSGPLWITSAARAADFPFSLGAAGEKLSVTAMGAVTAPTFVAAGTASSGASGSRTPGLPVGAAAGDLVLIFASTRNSGTGTVDTPTSWTSLLEFGNCKLLGRIYDGSWSMPTITYTGGAVNEDTIAQSAAFRGMGYDLSKIVVNSAAQLNGSAQDVALPSLTVRQDNCVAVYLCWKQDDWTSVTNPGGTLEIQEATTAAGNDASQVWGYQIQTAQTDTAFGTRTVTGGAAAISRGAVIALVGGYQVATVTRAANTVSKAQTAGTAVSLWKPAVVAL